MVVRVGRPLELIRDWWLCPHGVFAASLAESDPPVETPDDLTAAHIQAFRERYDNRRVQHEYVNNS